MKKRTYTSRHPYPDGAECVHYRVLFTLIDRLLDGESVASAAADYEMRPEFVRALAQLVRK